jgi:RNA polymerase sigma-70 factor (ECF subfamily)
MPETPHSLLERLRTGPDDTSWQKLVALYRPWLTAYLRRQNLPAGDVDDLIQDTLAILVKELPQFRHDLRRGAFRRWLRNITLNRLRLYWRARRPVSPADDARIETWLAQLEDPQSDLSRRWEEEHNVHVIHRLLELLEGDFEPRTWQAFCKVTLEGKSTAETAQELAMSPVAVRIAKSRVLTRFRQEIAGLLD